MRAENITMNWRTFADCCRHRNRARVGGDKPRSWCSVLCLSGAVDCRCGWSRCPRRMRAGKGGR